MKRRSNSPSISIIGTRGYPSYYGGFETAVRKISPIFADRGWDVLVYGRPGAAKINDPNLDKRINTHSTRGIESKSLSTLTYGFTSSLHAMWTKPDLALVMNVANGFWLPLLKLRGIPSVVNVDGIEWHRAKWGKLAKFVFKMGAKLTAKYADELIFDAKAIGEIWRRDFNRTGHVIPYGGESSEQLPLEPGQQHRKYVLIVARFVPENSVVEFMDAVELLAEDHPVVIVGSSGYGGEMDERASALDQRFKNVHWLGHISDDRRLHSLWQHAGAYFHGHSVGGTNPALVQAMALGAPVVARDTVYNREVLSNEGLFVDPDAKDIAAALDKVLSSPMLQQRLSDLSIDRAQIEYTWADVADKYERLAASKLPGYLSQNPSSWPVYSN